MVFPAAYSYLPVMQMDWYGPPRPSDNGPYLAAPSSRANAAAAAAAAVDADAAEAAAAASADGSTVGETCCSCFTIDIACTAASLGATPCDTRMLKWCLTRPLNQVRVELSAIADAKSTIDTEIKFSLIFHPFQRVGSDGARWVVWEP